MGFVENVNTLATNLTANALIDINTVSSNILDVITVADNIVNVNTTATNIANVNAVGLDLLEPVSEINTVAVNIADVNTVGLNIADINAVAAQVVPNMAEILLADDNAVIATTQAGISTTQAGLSAGSAAAALLSEQNAALSYDQFDDRYLGNKAVAPSLDNDGNVLLTGALYWDTVTTQMMVWSGTVWVAALTLSPTSVSTLTNKTLDSITNLIGANHIHHEVRNASGVPIPQGAVVTAQGIQSGTDYIEVVPVTDATTQIAVGITHAAIANNGTGLVLNTGMSDDVVNTNMWTVGTVLYVSNTGLTAIRPTTGMYQACAIVLRQHLTQGRLLVEFTEPRYIASTTQQGYTQLNDTLVSTSTALALTAAQGKVLQDSKQANLVSGTTIKTVGGATLLGAGDIPITDTSKLPLAGGTMTGAITALRETKVAMGANDINLSSGNVFTKTISGATTLTVSNWLSSGNANSFILELTNGGSAVVTWFAGVKWAGGTAPTLTAVGVDILGFYSHDGGTTVRGIVLAKDSK